MMLQYKQEEALFVCQSTPWWPYNMGHHVQLSVQLPRQLATLICVTVCWTCARRC
jgi:hypothetical protein